MLTYIGDSPSPTQRNTMEKAAETTVSFKSAVPSCELKPSTHKSPSRKSELPIVPGGCCGKVILSDNPILLPPSAIISSMFLRTISGEGGLP